MSLQVEKSEIVSLKSAIVQVYGEQHTHELDPALLIDQLPLDIKSITSTMTIRFRSDLIVCDIDYNMFMSKNHVIDGDTLKIGYRKLNIQDISVELIYKINLEM